jgi:hypothetical protein
MKQMDAENKAVQAETDARQDKMMEANLNALREETVTYQGRTEARQGSKKPAS